MRQNLRWVSTTLLSLGLVVWVAGCAGARAKGSKYDEGVYLQTQGKTEDAITAFQASLQIDPEDPTPRQALAAAYFAKGWRTQAVQEWETVLEKSSTDPSFYHKDGQPDHKAEWIADGIEANKKAVESLVDVYTTMAGEAVKESRWADAGHHWKRVTDLEPDRADAWLGLARAFKKLKDADGAYPAWKKVCELTPKEAEPYKELGYVCFQLEKLNEAEAAFAHYCVLKPDDPLGYSNHGTVLAKLNRFTEAQAAFDKALSIQTDMLAALNGKATAYYYQKDYVNARQIWAHVIELYPDDPTATENIRTLVNMGY
ncbi:MAG TPA: tetratricopeptide repeat protein [bacterium]|nr:tetratricopeptide repeat protein [bacterium]